MALSIYTIEAPDGKLYDIEGPAGADESDVLNFFKTEYDHPDFGTKIEGLSAGLPKHLWSAFESPWQKAAAGAIDMAGEYLIPENSIGVGKEKAQEALKPITETYRSAAHKNQLISQYSMPENEAAAFGTEAVDAVLGSLPYMMGGGAGLTLMFAGAGAGGYEDSLQWQKEHGLAPEELDRVDRNRALLTGAFRGVAEAGPEKLSGVMDKVGVGKGIQGKFWEIVLGEGGSEATTEALNMLYDHLVLDESPENAMEGIKQIAKAAVMGVVVGGVYGGVQYASSGKERAAAKQAESDYNAMLDSANKTNELRDQFMPEAQQRAAKEQSYIDELMGRDRQRDANVGNEYDMLDQMGGDNLSPTKPEEVPQPGSDEFARQQELDLATKIAEGEDPGLRTPAWKRAYNNAVKRGEAKVAKMKNPSAADRFFTIQEELNMDQALQELSPTEQAAWKAYEQQNLALAQQEDKVWQDWENNRPESPIKMEQLNLDLPSRPMKEGMSPLERDISDVPSIGPQSLYDIRDEVGNMTDEEIVAEYERTAADPVEASTVTKTWRNGQGIWGTPEYKAGLVDDMRESVLNNRIDQVKGLLGRQTPAWNLSSAELDTVASKSTRLDIKSKKAKTSEVYTPPTISPKAAKAAKEFPDTELKNAKRNKTGAWTVTGYDAATGKINVEYRMHLPDKSGKQTILNYEWTMGAPTISKTVGEDGVWSAQWKHGSTKNKSPNTKTHIPPKVRFEIEEKIRSRRGGEVTDKTRSNPTAASGTGKRKMRKLEGIEGAMSLEEHIDELIQQYVAEAEARKGPQVKSAPTTQQIAKEVARMRQEKEIEGLAWVLKDGKYVQDLSRDVIENRLGPLVEQAIKNVQATKETRNALTEEERAAVIEKAKQDGTETQKKMEAALKERMNNPKQYHKIDPLPEDAGIPVNTWMEHRDLTMISNGVAGRARAYQVLPNGLIRVLEITPTEIGKPYDVRIVSQGRNKYRNETTIQTTGKPLTEKSARKLLDESTGYGKDKLTKLRPEDIEALMEKERNKAKRRAADPSKKVRKGENDVGSYDPDTYDAAEIADLDDSIAQTNLKMEDVYIPTNPREVQDMIMEAWKKLPERKGEREQGPTYQPVAKRKTKQQEADEWLEANADNLKQDTEGEWISLDDVRAEMDSLESGETGWSPELAEENRMVYSNRAGLELTIEEGDILDALPEEERDAYVEELSTAAGSSLSSVAFKAKRYEMIREAATKLQDIELERASREKRSKLEREVNKVFGEERVRDKQIMRMVLDIRQSILEIADDILEPYYRNTTKVTKEREVPTYVGDANNALIAGGATLTTVGKQQKHVARRALRDVLRDNPEVLIAVAKAKYTTHTDPINDEAYMEIIQNANTANEQIRLVLGEIKHWLQAGGGETRAGALKDAQFRDPNLRTTEVLDSVKVHEVYKSSDPKMRNLLKAGRLPLTKAQVEIAKLKAIEERAGSESAVAREQRRRIEQEKLGGAFPQQELDLTTRSVEAEKVLEDFVKSRGEYTSPVLYRDSNGRFVPIPINPAAAEDVGTGRKIKSPNIEQSIALQKEMERLATGNVVGEVKGQLEDRLSAIEAAQVAESKRRQSENRQANFEATAAAKKAADEARQAARDELAKEMVALRKSIRDEEARQKRTERNALEKDFVEGYTQAELELNRREQAAKMRSAEPTAEPELSDQAREEMALQAAYDEEADRYSDRATRQLSLDLRQNTYEAEGEWGPERRFSDVANVLYTDSFDKATSRILDEMVEKAMGEYKEAQPKNAKPTGKGNPNVVDLEQPDPAGRAAFEVGAALDGVAPGWNWEEVRRVAGFYLTKNSGLRGKAKTVRALLDVFTGKTRSGVQKGMDNWAQAAQALENGKVGYKRFSREWDGALTDYLQDMQLASVEAKWGVTIPEEAIKHLDALKGNILDIAKLGLPESGNGAWSTGNVIGAVKDGRAYITKVAKSTNKTRRQISRNREELGKLAQIAWNMPTSAADLMNMSTKRLLSLIQTDPMGHWSSHLAVVPVTNADNSQTFYRTIQIGNDTLRIGETNDKNTKDVVMPQMKDSAKKTGNEKPQPYVVDRDSLIDFMSKHLPEEGAFATAMEEMALGLINTSPRNTGYRGQGASKNIQRARNLLLSDADFIAKASGAGASNIVSGTKLGKRGAEIKKALADELKTNRKLSVEEFLMKVEQKYPELKEGVARKRAELSLNLKVRETINELHDPETAIANTLTKIGSTVYAANMLQQIYEHGTAQGWVRQGRDDNAANWQPLAEKGTSLGDATFKLPTGVVVKGSNLRVPREVALAIHELSGQRDADLQQNPWLSPFFKLSQLTKWNAVIGNPEGLMRNFSSTALIHAPRYAFGTNGAWANNIGRIIAGRELKESLSQKQHAKMSASESAEVAWITQQMLDHGLLFDGSMVGSIYDLQKKAFGETSHRTQVYHKGGAAYARGKHVLETIFRLGDEAVKFPAFLVATSEYLDNTGHNPDIVKRAAKGEKLTEVEQAALTKAMANAAEVVKDSYPTFSRINKVMKSLSKFPVYFAFPGFNAEMVRTSGHVMYDSLNTIATGRMKDGTKIASNKQAKARAIAALRLMSTTSALSGSLALSTALASMMFGGDDDDAETFGPGLSFSDRFKQFNKEMRGLVQWYNKNSMVAVTNINPKDRSYDVVNVDYGMPSGTIETTINTAVQRILRAMNEDNAPLARELALGALDFVSTFAGNTDPYYGTVYKRVVSTNIETINSDRLLEKFMNKVDKSLGGENPGVAGVPGAVAASTIAAIPGAKLFDTGEKFLDAVVEIHDEALKNGEDQFAAYVGEVIPFLQHIAGAKTTPQTWDENLRPQIENQKRSLNTMTSNMMKKLRDPSISSYEEFKAKFDALNFYRTMKFDEMHTSIAAARKHLGVSYFEMEQVLGDMEQAQISLSDLDAGRYTMPPPEYFSDPLYEPDNQEQDPDRPGAAVDALTWQASQRLGNWYRDAYIDSMNSGEGFR